MIFKSFQSVSPLVCVSLSSQAEEALFAALTITFLIMHQRWARIRTGSDWIRTAIFFKIGGSGLDRTEKIFVVL